MEYLPFNVTARTAMLIGRENVSNSKSAIIELVKNTYDADSDYCILIFKAIDSDSINTLYIVDNGEGMDKETIVKYWMTIGTDNKQYEFISDNGRIKSGAKGIGRFALDRLGSKASMITKRKQKKTYIWDVDWSLFESGNTNINDVKASLFTYNEFKFKNELKKILEFVDLEDRRVLSKMNNQCGTIIKITNLRDYCDENYIEDIYKTLNTLVPPSNLSDFALFMYADNCKKCYGKIDGELADDYDYRIKSEYLNDGEVQISIYRNEFEYKKFPEKLLNSKEFLEDEFLSEKYFTGIPLIFSKKVSELLKVKNLDIEFNDILQNFNCEFNFLKRGQASNDQQKYCTKDISNKKRTEWLNIYGGIKLFRDNFKVRPYGEVNSTGFDWLDLGNRVERSPAAPSGDGAWRVRSNQVQGVVNISRTTNQVFKDQANREGIQDSEEFQFFKNLLIGIINEFERDRQKIYRLLDSSSEDKSKEKVDIGKKVAIKIKQKSAKNNNVDEDTILLAETVNIISDENEELRDEIRTLQALATTGLIINTLSHEIKDNRVLINRRIEKSISILEANEVSVHNWNKLKNNVNIINEKYRSLNEMFTMTLDIIKKDKRRRKSASLRSFINDVELSWREILSLRRICFTSSFSDDIGQYRLKFFASDLETILNNLIINSIEAFEDEDLQVESREIRLSISENKDFYIFRYTDNGPGLSENISDDEVFAPHETTKKNKNTGETTGTGLGMWIVKSIISEYNGECILKRSHSGFNFEFSLKKNIRRA